MKDVVFQPGRNVILYIGQIGRWNELLLCSLPIYQGLDVCRNKPGRPFGPSSKVTAEKGESADSRLQWAQKRAIRIAVYYKWDHRFFRQGNVESHNRG